MSFTFKYRITVNHSELKSVFYVISYNPYNETDYEILASFDNRKDAEKLLANLIKGDTI